MNRQGLPARSEGSKPTSGQTRTPSLGAARPLPPSADIGLRGAVRWSSCAILLEAAGEALEARTEALARRWGLDIDEVLRPLAAARMPNVDRVGNALQEAGVLSNIGRPHRY